MLVSPDEQVAPPIYEWVNDVIALKHFDEKHNTIAPFTIYWQKFLVSILMPSANISL